MSKKGESLKQRNRKNKLAWEIATALTKKKVKVDTKKYEHYCYNSSGEKLFCIHCLYKTSCVKE